MSSLSLAVRFFSTRFRVRSLIHLCYLRNPRISWATLVWASLNVSHSPVPSASAVKRLWIATWYWCSTSGIRSLETSNREFGWLVKDCFFSTLYDRWQSLACDLCWIPVFYKLDNSWSHSSDGSPGHDQSTLPFCDHLTARKIYECFSDETKSHRYAGWHWCRNPKVAGNCHCQHHYHEDPLPDQINSSVALLAPATRRTHSYQRLRRR